MTVLANLLSLVKPFKSIAISIFASLDILTISWVVFSFTSINLSKDFITLFLIFELSSGPKENA